ncbi:MAG: inorganic phosphate transporter [Candidatus Marinimicrobia bacterium]|jgi:inorganic phosphate transporter, PiT family|nr:inorganic phosphate transporter [Candidatus Neomarinimicrobiota bacterium]MBT3630078.1 inorganic phosphate transporter [Candidatus Neomarinimicrobiota bacterium]MBT3824245.1 inorganic phosphate transporter [Candidatus Neomarinimicrobiota bacterium]MBT4131697.1 inorganic phosphate transporter [Candidatus Neomarinimicrobiota bacterium]MBT4295473.1 inorganic phosphate transporter [Candidatus Neomarinimicrobiota bacterium]
MLILLFLSSGLFLGWSLGANDASNIFGTAVGTRMVKFYTAAIVASIFVVLGAVISGAGTTHTLGKLGAVDMIAGAFMVALAAAVTVLWMTKLSLPVSTSQAIVGAIVGWNVFAGKTTDIHALTKIASTWVMSPILAAVFSFIFFLLFKKILEIWKIHIFRLDAYTRVGLILVGAFGAYSLGANNIGNVMGVFVSVAPFDSLSLMGFTMNGIQQLFLLGGLAIAVGIFTYSKRVMLTVGEGVVKLTPQSALVVVLSQSIVLFLFASKGLEGWLLAHNLPTIPLVPVSSSQVVIGSVLGIGLAHGGRGIQYKVLGRIASGWVTTPIIAAVLSFISLFFLQNVFDQQVVKQVNQTEIHLDINSGNNHHG